uniref:Uncharacterized protein n=1 Tax=Anguilla anguilla TaxID=7936 RepID=A0A0E9W9R9_ANGAN
MQGKGPLKTLKRKRKHNTNSYIRLKVDLYLQTCMFDSFC